MSSGTKVTSVTVERLTKEEFLVSFDRVTETSPGQYSARCPGHPDDEPSLSIKIEELTAYLCCHAGCDVEHILNCIGLTMVHLHLLPSNWRKSMNGKPDTSTLTLDEFAKDKRLPVTHLKDMGLVEENSHVTIQYYLENGELAARHRKRTHLNAKQGSAWTAC